MKTTPKLIFCIIVLSSAVFCYCFMQADLNNGYSMDILDANNKLGLRSVITLDQLLSYPDNFTYSLTTLYNDRYFGADMFQLNITQTNGTATEIQIEVGQFLNTTKSDLQNMTVAKQEWVNLTGAGDSKVVNITVFCITVQGEVPPWNENYFIVAKKASGNLSLLLNYIANNSLYNFHYAQLAVWALSDGPQNIPAGYIYNDTEVDWVNNLLTAIGLGADYMIPYLPRIPGFNGWILLSSIGIILLPYCVLRLRRRD